MSFERLSLELPVSFQLNGRRFFKRSEIEHLKETLISRALGRSAPEYVKPETESFVNATQVARELGIARRTFARRVNESIERHNLPPHNPLRMNELKRAGAA
jgi:hypothetical protein